MHLDDNAMNPRRPSTTDTARMTRIRFCGNVIPTSWHRHILTNEKRPHSVAITLLGEICWWYRDREVRDESGLPIGWERKFYGAALQMSPKQFAAKFGFSEKSCQRALAHLEDLGLINRSEETVDTKLGRLGNVCFIRVVPEEIEKVTWLDQQADDQPSPTPPLDVPVQRTGPGRPNITRTTKQKNKTPKSPKRGQELSSGVKECDDPTPSLESPADRDEKDCSTSQSRLRNWVAEANSDPLAQQFLGVVGLNKFPEDHRASFARSFVKRRKSGTLRDQDIRLLSCLRGELPRVKSHGDWFTRYGELVALARELIDEERNTLQENSNNLADAIEQQRIVLASAKSFVTTNPDPADSLGCGMHLLLPRWALLVAFQVYGLVGVEMWKIKLREVLIDELSAESAAFRLLHDSGYDIPALLGVDPEEIQFSINSRQRERESRLRELDACSNWAGSDATEAQPESAIRPQAD